MPTFPVLAHKTAPGGPFVLVPNLDPLEHDRSSYCSRSNRILKIKLALERAKKALCNGIVPAVPLSTHTRNGFEPFERSLEFMCGVLLDPKMHLTGGIAPTNTMFLVGAYGSTPAPEPALDAK